MKDLGLGILEDWCSWCYLIYLCDLGYLIDTGELIWNDRI